MVRTKFTIEYTRTEQRWPRTRAGACQDRRSCWHVNTNTLTTEHHLPLVKQSLQVSLGVGGRDELGDVGEKGLADGASLVSGLLDHSSLVGRRNRCICAKANVIANNSCGDSASNGIEDVLHRHS